MAYKGRIVWKAIHLNQTAKTRLVCGRVEPLHQRLTYRPQVLNHRVLMPSTQSWYAFFAYGGSVAWYLILIAALIAALRKRIGKPWKVLHTLNYVAFGMATVHGWLIGTNVQGPVMRVIFVLLALIVLGVLVQRRLADRKRKKRRKA